MKELIIYIHERAVRIIYQYFISSFQSFQKLHLEDNSLNIHHKFAFHLASRIIFSSLLNSPTPYKQFSFSGQRGSIIQNTT